MYQFKIEDATGEHVADAEVLDFDTLLECLEMEADRLGVDRGSLRLRIIRTPEDDVASDVNRYAEDAQTRAAEGDAWAFQTD